MAKRRGSSLKESNSKMMSEQEQEERQRAYLARLHDIVVTCANFRHALDQFRDLEIERVEKESWERYLQCDTLPKPKSPVQIRTFLSKIRHFEDLEVSKSMDWTLLVDERSVLTQDIFQENLTRGVVEKAMHQCPGPYFEVNSRRCLELLRQVDALMHSEVEMDRIDLNQQIEIMHAYDDIQKEVGSLFDRLTYRVLSLQKVYMNSVNGIVATWAHSCDPWRMDLWGLLNVPIIFNQMEIPAMVAELPATGVEVQMPLSVLTDCLTLRCVHTRFDHHSEDAKSFEQEVIDSGYISNSGIIDMEQSMIGEWLLQQDIQEEVLLAMQRKREDYEETMQLIAERTDKANKEAIAKKDEKTVKIIIPKTPKEVPLVPPGMYPEVHDEFIKREEAQYNAFMDNYFHPVHLNMKPNEINLRENIIVGGIYSLTFVERPNQTKYQYFNIVLHDDGRVLRIIPDVVANLGSLNSDSIEMPRISEFTRASIAIESKVRLEENELPFFIVTVKLPPDLCNWGEPQVCHFLTEPERLSKRKISLLTPNLIDFQRISVMSTEVTASMTISTNVNRFASSIKSILRHSRIDPLDVKDTNVRDFSLDKILDKMEIRSLHTHCLPRMISSLKFSQELNEDMRDSEAHKFKPNRWGKRVETVESLEAVQPVDNFDFSLQNAPERVFPRFPPVSFAQFNSIDETCNKRSACGIVTSLDKIKQEYVDRPKQILQQMDNLRPKKKVERVEGQEKLDFREAESSDEDMVRDLGTRKSAISRGVRASTARMSRKQASISHRKSAKPLYISDEPHISEINERDFPEPPVMVTHWTKRYIFDVNVDTTTNVLTFKTDRLGVFGLAFKRYEQFPFRDWYLQPNSDNPDEIIFSLDTYHVRMLFYITSQGVRGHVVPLSKEYTANPIKYVDIKEPISDFRELRRTLVDSNLNIFAENDASYYISNGYFSIKHVATEMHTYNTMALHCKSMKFYRSSWNRLAGRRDIVMNMKVAKDTSEYTESTTRITPEKTTFVKVSELCSDNIDIVKLFFEETWRNVNNYVDLNQAINSLNPQAHDAYNKEAKLFVYIYKFLSEIRPLSFS